MSNKHRNGDMLRRMAVIALLDVVCVFASFFVSLWISKDFQFSAMADRLEDYLLFSAGWSLVTLLVFYFSRLYNSIWSFASVDELIRILFAYGVLGVIGAVYLLANDQPMPTAIYVIGGVFNAICTVAIRFSYRLVRGLRGYLRNAVEDKGRENVMIIGAGEAGRSLTTEFENSAHVHSRVVCIIDDNPSKHGKRLMGIPIVGGRDQIPAAVKEHNVQRIIFAIPTSAPSEKKAILDICATTGCKVQVVPGIYQLVNEEVNVSQLREVDPQDLLGRDPIKVNMEEIFDYISGKVVMVTGGGGSIGSELCRQIAKANPKQLIIFDIYENNAYEIQMELNRTCPNLNLEVLIGSVRNWCSTLQPTSMFP